MRHRPAPRLWMRAALALLGAGAALLALAGPARADDAQQIRSAISALSAGQPLYVSLSGITLDRAAVQGSLGPATTVAVIDVADADAAANAIGQSVRGTAASIVASATTIEIAWDSDAYCGDYPAIARDEALTAHRAQFSQGDYTATIVALAASLERGPAPGSRQCDVFLGAGSDSESKAGSGGGWVILVVLVVVVAVLVGGYLIYRRRAAARSLATAEEKVMPYYTRLAGEILGFDPKGDSTALGSLADASAKYAAAGEQIEAADAVADWAQARTTVLEGLIAIREARLALGMPEGEPIPQIAPSIDQLTAPQEVSVEGMTLQGYPQYQPGASYYYGGGNGIPGGWYATPFWQQLMIGALAGRAAGRRGGLGGFGGGIAGGGRGSGGSGGGWRSSGGSRGSGGGWRSSGGGRGGGGGGWRSSGRR